MNQRDIILNELKRKEWFSLADALSLDAPIYRLSERIRELKEYGHNIISRRVNGKTYQEYKLIPPEVPVLPPAFEPKPVLPNPTNVSANPPPESAMLF